MKLLSGLRKRSWSIGGDKMEKKRLIKELEEISNEMEDFLVDSVLQTIITDFGKIQRMLEDLIDTIENEKEETE